MSLTFGFKGDFQKFLATYGVPALQDLKKSAISKLTEVNAKIGEFSEELEKLKQQQIQIQQVGIRATQQEIDKTRATINRINAKIRAIQKKCAKASIAKKALVRDTGARALRGVVEELMLEVMFELPDQKPGRKYVIDKEVAEGKAPLFKTLKRSKKETA